jgi:ATP-binding cassette subfamily B protein
VWFRYPGADRPALRGASLHVDAGEVVALVGENGSGKTTLAKVLAALYRPEEGRVLWDGIDAADYDQERARRSIAVLFQDFARYFMSARANIEVGRPEVEDQLDTVVEAARRAGVHDELARLPLGFDTLLGPEFLGGTDLSVGQWQRLALARAFYRDPALLILDEPTASLDPLAESRQFESMRSLFRDRAVLLISHRFSSVRAADRIYVLEHGVITEAGGHDELMARGGRYAEMFTRQASAYLDLDAKRR